MVGCLRFFVTDKKRILKNALLAKLEDLNFHALVIEDIIMHDNDEGVFNLSRRTDISRPPRLFYMPTVEEVQKMIIAVTSGVDVYIPLDIDKQTNES